MTCQGFVSVIALALTVPNSGRSREAKRVRTNLPLELTIYRKRLLGLQPYPHQNAAPPLNELEYELGGHGHGNFS
jgi:hypothetical protein